MEKIPVKYLEFINSGLQGDNLLTMIREFIHYIIREEKQAEHEHLVQKIFRELQELQPDSITLTVFKLSNLYIHVTCFENEIDEENFGNLSSFKAFSSALEAQLLEQPIINEYAQLNSYAPSR
jgi:hypothetical protein